MKSLLRSTLNWFKRATETQAENSEPSPAAEANLAVQVEPAKQEPEPAMAPARVPEPEPASVLVTPQETPMPMLTPSPTPAKPTGPVLELAVKIKAGVVYATCPHCQSTWNLRERVLRQSLRRQEVASDESLTCPNCDNLVSLPPRMQLR